MAGAFIVAGVVGQDFVAKIEGKHAAQQAAVRSGNGQYFTIIAKDLEQGIEVMFGHGRRAMAMNIVRVKGEKAFAVAVDRADQPIFDALAHHGPLLARDGQHVFVNVGQDRLAEGDIQILRRPLRMARRDIAKFQMVDAKFPRQFLCRIFQCRRGIGIDGCNSTIDGEGQCNQCIAEQPAIDMGKRQDAADSGIVFGIEKIGGMPEHVPDNSLPGRTMKEARFRTSEDELIPARSSGSVGRIEMPDLQHAGQASARKR